MKKLLLLGGTSEEHGLLTALTPLPAAVTLCVATDYGKALLPEDSEKLSVRVGRMDSRQMADFIRREGCFCVVDATHPYAAEVTRNIREAARETGVPCLRLLRERSDTSACLTVASVSEAAEALEGRAGSALIATGSKELGAFTRVPDYRERLYPRVLPSVESIQICLSLGFPPGHIIAMQGPFSKELNIALMRQFDIRFLVTKDGGKSGGFPEKREAAEAVSAELIVIRRPDDDGLDENGVIRRISELLGL